MVTGSPVSPAPRFAVIFKTYAWDTFIEARARACERQTGPGDFYISVDQTNRAITDIPFPRVVPTSIQNLIAFGLPNRCEAGSLIWWSPDYVHYEFRHQYPDYDYYVFVEYDAVITGGIARMVAQAAATDTDLVAHPIRNPHHEWFWSLFHQQTYSLADLQASLNCVSLFSARALDHLNQRRRDMAAHRCRYWPSSEAFILTEITRANLAFRPLGEFGDTSRYDWFPPMLEQDLPNDPAPAFYHPVLDRRRYIASTLKSTRRLRNYLDPNSPMHQDLARFPRAEYMPLLPGATVHRVKTDIADKIRRARAHWYLKTSLPSLVAQ